MIINAEKVGGPSTSDTDSRITGLGHRLRRYKLDELPQLLNVLTGDMSLVGPRPEVPIYAALYNEEEKKLLQLRPGMTDWASIWNSDEGSLLAGEPDPEKAYLEKIRPTKIKLQLQYYYQQGVATDLRIILETLVTLLKSRFKRIQSSP